MILTALTEAGLDPAKVSAMETHGTGTVAWRLEKRLVFHWRKMLGYVGFPILGSQNHQGKDICCIEF